MTKCYSIDEEDFNLDDIGEVIERIEDNLPEGEIALGREYWEAEAVPVLHKHIITNDDITSFLETLDEQFDEFIEDPDSVYSDVPKEAIAELKELVLAWADKYVAEGRYYRVKNVVKKTIEADDLESPSGLNLAWVDELEDNPDSLTNHPSLGKSVL